MEIELSTEQKALAQQAIEGGRILHLEDAVKEALSLWENRERVRSEILATVDAAEASLAREEGRIITAESMRKLAFEVGGRGRARFLAGQSAHVHS